MPPRAARFHEARDLPWHSGSDTIVDVLPSTAAVASSPKLLDRVRWRLRVRHYSIRTEQAYVDWIRRFILFITNGIQMRWANARSRSS